MSGDDGAWGLRAAFVAVAGIAGAAMQMQQAALWPAAVYAALLGLAAMGVLLAMRTVWRRTMVLALALALALFATTGLRAGWRLADGLPAVLEGQDIVVTGRVADLPRQYPDGVRFTFEPDSATHAGQPVAVPSRLALGWYRGWDEDALIAAPFEDLRAGQRWRFTVRLKQPHGSLNPQGFDYELWLFEQGIRATGTVRATDRTPATRLAAGRWAPVERLRQQVRDAIALRVADARAAGVLAALAVGDQAAIERSDWELFRSTGIAHLVSISGLHVTMFAWIAGAVVGWLWRRSTRAILWLPAPTAARWGGVGCAALYALLAGWGVPAQRTVWMLATAALLMSIGVRWPWPLVLLAAALVVTVLDPWALLQPGFWLSFVAVGLLLTSTPARQATAPPAGRRQWLTQALRHGLRTQVVATLGLAPLTLVFFQQVSVVGFFANLVAIPLVTLLITPLALLGLLVPPLWQAGAWLVQSLTWWLAWLAAWPGAVWIAGVAPLWAQAAGLLGAALLVAPLPWALRALAVPLMLPLLLPVQPRPPDGAMRSDRGRRWPGQRGVGAHAQPPAAARRRTAILARQRGRHARAAAAAARAGDAADRPADVEPPRCRPCRRRGGAARRVAGARAVVFARGGASPACRRDAAYALRGGAAVAVGWRALRGAAPERAGLRAPGTQTQRDELRLARGRCPGPQPAADR